MSCAAIFRISVTVSSLRGETAGFGYTSTRTGRRKYSQSFLKYGKILQQKVDDMQRQFETVHCRKYPIALVTDSACDLPMEIVDRYQIHVVPTNLSFGEDHFIDRLTISPETFYAMMREREEQPGTSQPTPADFNRLYDFLSRHYESIVAVHLSEPLSGTCGASAAEAAKAADKTGKKITVVNSRHASASEGLVVLRTAEAIAEGKSHEEVVETAVRAAGNTRNFVAVRTIENLIRSGRISRMKGRIGNLLGVTPLVVISPEGKAVLSRNFLSQSSSLKHIRSLIEKQNAETPIRYYALAHANARELALETAKELSAMLGQEPAFIVDAAPVLGLHAGEGTVSVVITW